MWNKGLCCFLSLFISVPAFAEPIISDVALPPVSFSRVTDPDLLDKIGLDPSSGAWCYDDQANAILITAPARERASCELRLLYETEKMKVKHKFEIDKLNLRIDTLNVQHKEILKIKDQEIDRLTDAALKRPNDYSIWWATGGFVTGALVSLGVVMLVTR